MPGSEKRPAVDEEAATLTTSETVGSGKQPSSAMRPLASKLRKKLDEPPVADVEDWSPPGWQQVLQNVRDMRATRDAPVDSMGAESFATDPLVTDPKVARLHVLVGLMLSSQTQDAVTHAAMCRLKEAGLTVHTLADMSETRLAELIKPKKAQYLKRSADILQAQHDGDIPASAAGLCKLPGVGPKMAHLCMNIAWKKASGIGVDTHVHRISNRLGWVRRPTNTPEQTQSALEAWLPREHWPEINLLLVGFGQQRCTAVAPRCDGCLNYSVCPASNVAPKKTKRSRVRGAAASSAVGARLPRGQAGTV